MKYPALVSRMSSHAFVNCGTAYGMLHLACSAAFRELRARTAFPMQMATHQLSDLDRLHLDPAGFCCSQMLGKACRQLSIGTESQGRRFLCPERALDLGSKSDLGPTFNSSSSRCEIDPQRLEHPCWPIPGSMTDRVHDALTECQASCSWLAWARQDHLLSVSAIAMPGCARNPIESSDVSCCWHMQASVPRAVHEGAAVLPVLDCSLGLGGLQQTVPQRGGPEQRWQPGGRPSRPTVLRRPLSPLHWRRCG